MAARKYFDLTLRYLAPVLLALVAVQQIYLVHTSNLSVWRGGGFGMFAAIDGPHHRSLRAYLRTEAGEVPIPVQTGASRLGTLERTAAEARVIPTQRRLQTLATGIGGMTWIAEDSVGVDPGAPKVRKLRGALPPAGVHVVEFSGVRVEVSRMRFDREKSRVIRSSISEHIWSRP